MLSLSRSISNIPIPSRWKSNPRPTSARTHLGPLSRRRDQIEQRNAQRTPPQACRPGRCHPLGALITGQQIKAARELLGWAPSRLAQRAKLHSAIVQRAESVAGEPPITLYQQALIRNALERFGVEFTNGNEPGVKLRKAPTSRR